MIFRTWALMIPAKYFSKNNFIFQYFKAVNFGLFLWTPHTDNRVKPNKLKITPYENIYFNSMVIILLADPTVLRTILLLWNQFCAKKLKSAYVYLPLEGSQGAPKMAIFEIRKCTKTTKFINFRAEQCQKYALYWKRIQIKVPAHSLACEKVSEPICLSPSEGS